MAQLKDTIITGNLSVTGNIYPSASANTGAASGSTADSTAFNSGDTTPTFTGTAGTTTGTSVTPAGTITGSLSGTVLTLGFSGTAASHSHPFTPAGSVSSHHHSVGAHHHGLNSHTHTYTKVGN